MARKAAPLSVRSGAQPVGREETEVESRAVGTSARTAEALSVSTVCLFENLLHRDSALCGLWFFPPLSLMLLRLIPCFVSIWSVSSDCWLVVRQRGSSLSIHRSTDISVLSSE